VVRGDIENASFSVWWIQDNHAVAAFVLNRPEEERELAPQWIETRQPVSIEELANEEQPLAEAEMENTSN
jgi:3-phenylpropionate/trans-cinnamate dioxygenase ferredoxin reductase subunit